MMGSRLALSDQAVDNTVAVGLALCTCGKDRVRPGVMDSRTLLQSRHGNVGYRPPSNHKGVQSSMTFVRLPSDPPPPKYSHSPTTHVCPRCGGQVLHSYGDVGCLQCGWQRPDEGEPLPLKRVGRYK